MTASGSGLGVLQHFQEVLEGHRHDFNADGHINGTIPGLGTHDCWCGEAFSTTDTWAEHVAALVLALFTQENGSTIDGQPVWWRFVSPIEYRS